MTYRTYYYYITIIHNNYNNYRYLAGPPPRGRPRSPERAGDRAVSCVSLSLYIYVYVYIYIYICMYIYIYIYTHTCTHTIHVGKRSGLWQTWPSRLSEHIGPYIYIYIEREREIDVLQCRSTRVLD